MKALPPLRLLVSCWVLTQCLLVPLPVRAQDAGVPDSGSLYDIPDASVGSGGADRDNPEGEDSTGRPGGTCHNSAECAIRFTCTQGRCRYTGIRQAERVGCLLGPEGSLAVMGLGLALGAWRRGKR